MIICNTCGEPEKGNITESEDIEITCARCLMNICETDAMKELTERTELTIQQKLQTAKMDRRRKTNAKSSSA